jgi:hypothetical protein
MIIVVSLAKSDKGSEDVIFGRMSIIERLISKIMSKRVDTESGMVNKDKSTNPGKVKSTSPISPEKTGDGSGDKESHDEDDESVVLVLHANEFIRVEIGDIGSTDAFWVLFENHPAEMGIH